MDHMIQSSNCTIPSVSQTEIDKHFALLVYYTYLLFTSFCKRLFIFLLFLKLNDIFNSSMGTENKKESFGTRETLT